MLLSSHFFVFILLNFKGVLSAKCSKKIPENNHGRKPTLEIKKAQAPQKNTLAITIPVYSPEWSYQFTYHVNAFLDDTWCAIMSTTNSQVQHGEYGYRAPAIYLNNPQRYFSITNAVNGDKIHKELFQGLIANTSYDIEFHQRYKSGGVYTYSIVVNGDVIHTVDNNQAVQFYNVKIWLSDPWHRACDGNISNFKFTHFF
ncbi:uncharacterized protein [Clytia hemisphaerica]|uniref:Cnidarian restricted protein n=1 Tax=Clytia hemisphaerica TaxID=252671 RepID=A0A7M5UZC4_9CNID